MFAGDGVAVVAPLSSWAAADGPQLTAGIVVHVDTKKLGVIPDGGGWRMHGRGSTQDRQAGVIRDRAARRGASSSRGYVFLHHAVDDHSRLAYSERLGDERGETAASFWIRARAFFAEHDVTVTAVMTDNGACYRSHVFAAALGATVKHHRTHPFRPQFNGKVERFNCTLATGWAYAHPYISEVDRARHLPRMAPSLQSPQTPQRHRRPRSLSPHSQPPGEGHLGRV